MGLLRPDAKLRDQFTLTNSPVETVSLHTKAAVFDRMIGFVSSFNLDPRSNNINTETRIIVHDPTFASQLAYTLTEEMLPETVGACTGKAAVQTRGNPAPGLANNIKSRF